MSRATARLQDKGYNADLSTSRHGPTEVTVSPPGDSDPVQSRRDLGATPQYLFTFKYCVLGV